MYYRYLDYTSVKHSAVHPPLIPGDYYYNAVIFHKHHHFYNELLVFNKK